MSKTIKNHDVKVQGPSERRRALLRGASSVVVLDARQRIRKRTLTAYEALCQDTQAISQDFRKAFQRKTAGVRVQ